MVDAWASEQDDASSVELGDDYNLPMPDYMMLKAAPEYSAIDEIGPSSEQTVKRGEINTDDISNDKRPSISSYDSSCVFLPRTSKLPFDPNVSDLFGLRQYRSHQSIAISKARMKDIPESSIAHTESGPNMKKAGRPQLSIDVDMTDYPKVLHNKDEDTSRADQGFTRNTSIEDAPALSPNTNDEPQATQTPKSKKASAQTTESNTSIKGSYSERLPYPITPAIFDTLASVMNAPFIAQFSKTKKDSKGRPVMTAATVPRIVAQITSEQFMDYELLSDFFLTFRSYLSPEDLALLLYARLEWALMRRDAEGKIILIRVFAALRHWVLNYFVEDFIVNYSLRASFCGRLNSLFAALRRREVLENTSYASDIKVLVDLKRCWVGQCTLCYDTQSPLSREQDVFFEPDQEIGPIAQCELDRSRRLSRYSDLRTSNKGVFALVHPSTTQNSPAISPTSNTEATTPIYPSSSESSGYTHTTSHDSLEKRRRSVTAPRITSSSGYSHKQCGSYSNSLRSSLGTLEEKDNPSRQRFSGGKSSGKANAPSSPKKLAQKRALAPPLARLRPTSHDDGASTTPHDADVIHSHFESSLPNTPQYSPMTADGFNTSRAVSGDLFSNQKSTAAAPVGVRRMSSLPNPRVITRSGASGTLNTANDTHLAQLPEVQEQAKSGMSAMGKPKVKQLIETFKWRPFKERLSDRNLGSLDKSIWQRQQQLQQQFPAKALGRMRSRSRSQSVNRLSRDENTATGTGNMFKFRTKSGGGSGWKLRLPSMTQNNSKQSHDMVDILGEYAALAYWKHVNPTVLNDMIGSRPLSQSIVPIMEAPQTSIFAATNSQDTSVESRMRNSQVPCRANDGSIVVIDDTSMAVLPDDKSDNAPPAFDRQSLHHEARSPDRLNDKTNLSINVPQYQYDEDHQITPRPTGFGKDDENLPPLPNQTQQKRDSQYPEIPKQSKFPAVKVPSAFQEREVVRPNDRGSTSSITSNTTNDPSFAPNTQKRGKSRHSPGNSNSVAKRVKSIRSKLRRQSTQVESNHDTSPTLSSSHPSSKFSYKDQNESSSWNNASSPQNRRYIRSMSSAFLSHRSGSLDGYQYSPSISTRTDVSSIQDLPEVNNDPNAPKLRRLPGGNLRKAQNVHELRMRPWSFASTVRDTDRTYSLVESVMSSNGLVPLSQTITARTGTSQSGSEETNSGDIKASNDRCTLKVDSCESVNDTGLKPSAGLQRTNSKSIKSNPSALELPRRRSKPYSLISTHSSQHPIGKTASFEAAVTQFSGIPDDDDGGVESTLLKLEGKWEPRDFGSPAMIEHFFPEWDGSAQQTAPARDLDGNPTVTVRELSGSFVSGKTGSGLSSSARPFLSMASSVSGHANMNSENRPPRPRSTPSLVNQDTPRNPEFSNNIPSDAQSGTSFLDTRDSLVRPRSPAYTGETNGSRAPEHARGSSTTRIGPNNSAPHSSRTPVSHVENGNHEKHEQKPTSHNPPTLCFRVQQHAPFILSHKAHVLAEQFTLIEQATLNDVDWRDLVEMKWNVSTNDPIFLNWAEFVASNQGNGIDVVITRFNLMVKWVLSEVILTSNIQMRAQAITKFINIAKHARLLRNFSTTTQIVIALASATCASLTKTWDLVGAKHKRTFEELEALLHPKGNFVTLRDEMENQILQSQGCIPFLGLYVQDLTFNAQASSHITIPNGPDITTTSVQEPVQLVNFERHRTTAEIVKSALRLIDASTKYDMHTLNGVTERCLWISALPDNQVRELSQNIQSR